MSESVRLVQAARLEVLAPVAQTMRDAERSTTGTVPIMSAGRPARLSLRGRWPWKAMRWR